MERHATCAHTHTHNPPHTHTQHTHLYVGSEECFHTASPCGRAPLDTTFNILVYASSKGPNSALISSNLEWNDSYISRPPLTPYTSCIRWDISAINSAICHRSILSQNNPRHIILCRNTAVKLVWIQKQKWCWPLCNLKFWPLSTALFRALTKFYLHETAVLVMSWYDPYSQTCCETGYSFEIVELKGEIS